MKGNYPDENTTINTFLPGIRVIDSRATLCIYQKKIQITSGIVNVDESVSLMMNEGSHISSEKQAAKKRRKMLNCES